MTVLRRGPPQSRIARGGRTAAARSDIAGSPVMLMARPSPFVPSYGAGRTAGVAGARAAHRYPTSSRATATTILVGCLPRRSMRR
jgi:hypothetical protein